MPQAADILITKARVLTSNPAQPRAGAVAVQGNRIAFVGSGGEAAGVRGPQTRVIDGQNLTLMPGFIDSHYHLLLGSLHLDEAQLFEAKELAALTQILQDFAAGQPSHAGEAA